RKARAKARDPARGGQPAQPLLGGPERLARPPLTVDLTRQKEPVAPERADDLEVARLRLELLGELFRQWFSISKEEQPLFLVDGLVAVDVAPYQCRRAYKTRTSG